MGTRRPWLRPWPKSHGHGHGNGHGHRRGSRESAQIFMEEQAHTAAPLGGIFRDAWE